MPDLEDIIPNTGLVSFNEIESPPLVREYKRLKKELKEVEEKLAELEGKD